VNIVQDPIVCWFCLWYTGFLVSLRVRIRDQRPVVYCHPCLFSGLSTDQPSILNVVVVHAKAKGSVIQELVEHLLFDLFDLVTSTKICQSVSTVITDIHSEDQPDSQCIIFMKSSIAGVYNSPY
jgi:hypothetical protein